MFNWASNLFGSKPVATPSRRHLAFDDWPAAVYAIGDIHGCLVELRQLEAAIARDAAAIDGEKWIVGLGDYIDRGPNSAGVLDQLLMKPPKDFKRISIAGNHEIMMLEFLHTPTPRSDWLTFGGLETLFSYGIAQSAITSGSAKDRHNLLQSHIPNEHRELLSSLPLSLSLPGVAFVHAGIRRGIPLSEQSEADLLWIRKEFFDAPIDDGLVVVHGHTPGAEAVFAPGRICVDTGAFATGRLTAVRLMRAQAPVLLAVEPAPAAGRNAADANPLG